MLSRWKTWRIAFPFNLSETRIHPCFQHHVSPHTFKILLFSHLSLTLHEIRQVLLSLFYNFENWSSETWPRCEFSKVTQPWWYSWNKVSSFSPSILCFSFHTKVSTVLSYSKYIYLYMPQYAHFFLCHYFLPGMPTSLFLLIHPPQFFCNTAQKKFSPLSFPCFSYQFRSTAFLRRALSLWL